MAVAGYLAGVLDTSAVVERCMAAIAFCGNTLLVAPHLAEYAEIGQAVAPHPVVERAEICWAPAPYSAAECTEIG